MNLKKRIYTKHGDVATVRKPNTKTEKRGKHEKDMTIMHMLDHILLNTGDDKNPESHLIRHSLWEKITENGENVKLTNEEKDLIEKLSAEKLDILVSAQVIKELRK